LTRVDATLAQRGPAGDLLAHRVQLACLLEVSAPKPGNITPSHEFADTTYADMLRSALALGQVFTSAHVREQGVGQLIADAVAATAQVAGANTNLGIVLLFAPLARASVVMRKRETLGDATERVLEYLGVSDAAIAYPAIVAAAPGGLGHAPAHDVSERPRVTLREAMAAAADRDSIASEYATGYATVFGTGLPLLSDALRGGTPTLEAIVTLHLRLLASERDTLIERKAGRAAAWAVSADAQRVLDGRLSIAEFDASLRGPDHRLNPGTTADLVAATLLAAMLSGMDLP
jgi:triphosphoribosyl-dephospho-CoA synthase